MGIRLLLMPINFLFSPFFYNFSRLPVTLKGHNLSKSKGFSFSRSKINYGGNMFSSVNVWSLSERSLTAFQVASQPQCFCWRFHRWWVEMLVLKALKNVRELRHCKRLNARLQSTEFNVNKDKKLTKARRFLKPLLTRDLKPHNVNFVAAVFGRGFDKEILEYPQVFEEKDIDTIINQCTAVEKFLNNNPKIKLNEQTLQELKALELFGLSVPQKYGGAGYNRTEINFLLECTGSESHIGRFLGCNEDFGCRILSTYGSEEQKAKYLPRLAEGQSSITLAYLENGSMIDFSNFQGYAITDSENKGYILNARKKWVHHANIADLILVLAKTTNFSIEEEVSTVKFNMFLAERNTPGITVHKVLTNNLEDFSLYEIDIQDVFLPERNLLGSSETCGVTVLKSALSHNFLTDASLCCSLIKQIVDEAYYFIEENGVFKKLDRGYIMIQNNLSHLTMYAFVLESVVYLLSGRFDVHEEHDLLDESILGKIIAIEMLKCATQKYIEILGCESFRTTGVLEKALKTLQYYSVMDENIEYLKMMVGGNGLCHASLPLSDRVKKLRNIPDNFSFTLKELFKARNFEKNLRQFFKIKQEVHFSLEDPADLLESSLCKFSEAIECNFLKEGQAAMENEHIIIKFAEIVAYLYAMTACLSRANSSVCYDFDKYKIDNDLTQKFASIASHKIESLIDEEVNFMHLNLLYREIGKITFKNKGYPAQHPLTRTY